MNNLLGAAQRLNINEEALIPFGRGKAKIDLGLLSPARTTGASRLVLVSAITPTAAGEGKTTTAIGLADAIAQIGRSVCLALREPSLGPCFGQKGGGTGGGESVLVPSDDINLHFTGDFHAVTTANNLIAAVLDNHLHHQSELDLDVRRMLWRRVLDVNDRVLRQVVVGLGGKANGVPREAGFDITAASEVMAMLCLAEHAEDLRQRLDRTLVAFDRQGRPIKLEKLSITGSLLALLKDALLPNLVVSKEGTPALVHGGPFANIAHGCNSVIATRTALAVSDFVITEAGFGFDLGAEKFFDIKCRSAGLDAACVVLVASVRALKMHGGQSSTRLASVDPEAVRRGLPNLEKHVENIRCFGKPMVVALNRFDDDAAEEIEIVRSYCREHGLPFAVTDHYRRGGEGARPLAELVLDIASKPVSPFAPLYALESSVADKIATVVRKMYGASDVDYTKEAELDLRDIQTLGYTNLPVCIAKTATSLSSDPNLRGRPKDFDITVRGIRVNAGAGFLVVLTGDILRMPGLPRHPRAEQIRFSEGEVIGLK